ncbi:hypothetical protein ABOM_009446 [Aspergillus bombycis]|uniref:Zn(2)-C6 fungal-type domain-containing protein n=1 Tax=Aspergillus bombycis TaxID=109264 RepID=A0A1F7ZTR6_9EURO|nr:hypothetical protein ABOM_009446 [Aspergillus bombycis]OGM42844.1 hypothetical protein ABOM_009446 [Aspergillus bombycis]
MDVATSHKSKPRATASCHPCRTRKVKCNRLSPCEACITRGIQEECKYSAPNEDRQAIAQAEMITELRGKVNQIREQIAQRLAYRSSFDDLEEEEEEEAAAMEIVYSALRLGTEDLVWHIVGRIRNGEDLRDLARDVARDIGIEDDFSV